MKRPRRHVGVSLALGLLAGGVACHDNVAGPRDAAVADSADATEDSAEPLDLYTPDTAPADTASPTDADADGADVGPAPGELGAPCTDAAECNGSWCITGRDGDVCSKACTEGCPLGWGCRQNVAVLPDVAFICMPPLPTLCRPCTSNADCVPAYDNTPHACVPFGDDGAFCGGLCAADADCPADHVCSAVLDIAGNATRQCVPTAGECDCSGSAIAAAATTVCSASNTFGRCVGARTCAATGLTDCDAIAPQVDLCNGADDNCDGHTDEAFAPEPCANDNAWGSCAGVTVCGSDGQRCDAPVPAPERCDGASDEDCDGFIDEEDAVDCVPTWYDGDGDGVGVGAPRCLCGPDGFFTAPLGGDCDDAAKKVFPDAAERCNGADDDCDGLTDEPGATGCVDFYADGDGDGFGDPDDVACLCAPSEPYTRRNGLDCDDTLTAVNPAASETCGGADEDCDGQTDEEGAAGCDLFFADADGDLFGDPHSFRCLCAPAAPFTTAQGGDCNDDATLGAAQHPGLVEACDGVDNDCDGLVDEAGATGCAPWYRDDDEDTYGLNGDVLCLCGADAVAGYTAERAGDCDDGEAAANPDAVEACDGVDNDCDDIVDEADAEGCAPYHADRDRDTYGVAEARCLCAPTLPFTASSSDDCDDANPFIHPGGAEVCNGLDDDCDGSTDEGVTGQCSPFYKDLDHDGWGRTDDSQCLCAPDGDYTSTRPGDCDDARTDIYPFAEELCNGGVDDDCDGQTDEAGALGCAVYFRDGDQDLAGAAGDSLCLCAPEPVARYTALAPGDCDDAAPSVHPGALEACNGVDDDCDNQTDEVGATGCDPYLRDTDGDTWGVAGDTLCLCAPAGVYTAAQGGDCDDLEGAIHPARPEVCDGLDNDCNGVADDPGIEGCVVRYRDADGDGHGKDGDSQCLCGPLGTLTALHGGDCDDLLGTVNPDAPERCNHVDDDCDGQTDEAGAAGCQSFLKDADGDGFGVAGDAQCLCQPGPVYRAVVPGDCDDGAIDVNPGEAEVCNGADDDCDGATDEDGAGGCLVRWLDADRDTFGKNGAARCLCTPTAPWDAATAGDCDDGSAAIAPGASEVCGDVVDNDCDGFVDEAGAAGCTVYLLDADGDGWGLPGQTQCLCSPQGAYSATQGPDCDDGNARRSPGQPEVCDGVDNNCVGGADEPGTAGCQSLWVDADDDTWGVDGSALCLCLPVDDYTANRGGDCDDDRAAVHPTSLEVCDSLDNDCDGVVDEGCGLPTVNWPTFMQNARRTGHALPLQGPTTATLKWKKKLGSTAFANSPLIDEVGDVIVLLGDTVYKLRSSDGQTLWTRALPAPAFARASPTVRVGGTIVAPAGNQVVMLAKSGEVLWIRDFGGAPGDQVVGNPLVDPIGDIYVISNTHARRLDAAGEVLWATGIENTATHASDPGLGADGRLYFATADRVYAMTPGGVVNWTWQVAGKPPGASVTLTEVARILVPAGDTLYLLADGQTQAIQIDTLAFGGALVQTNAALYSDGWDCCNPAEFPLVSPVGSNGLRRLNASLDLAWSVALPKRAGPSATPVFDRDGDIYVGSNSTTTQGALFYAKRYSNGANVWTYRADATDIDGAAAVGAGFVIFGDASGTLYRIGN
ncbi:MAG: hypothetical protein CVU56_14935 [Deltaproteobacteria bacterium HGW-Deltaproteobacteria-14]|nr:MAG: hypothetical protein CVU56_14935 [Deltaproteobacteria bacterium HGW-Deltaproteobacteria-14]